MEPTLNDMDDYQKPLSHTKIETISVAFLATLLAYAAFTYVIHTLG
ncbi:hypothetical protein [Sulfurovum mangrovi]|nr:hypothetical protein [Sulfurovum mangrovi]UFH58458.1 hypothetical protein LN246_08855 [Sulfurovum mangrovi]